MFPLSIELLDSISSSSSLYKDKGAVGLVLLLAWSFLGTFLVGDGHPFGVEDVLYCKGQKKSLERGSLVYFLEQFGRLAITLFLGIFCSYKDVHLLCPEIKLFFVDGPTTLVQFVDWVGSLWVGQIIGDIVVFVWKLICCISFLSSGFFLKNGR